MYPSTAPSIRPQSPHSSASMHDTQITYNPIHIYPHLYGGKSSTLMVVQVLTRCTPPGIRRSLAVYFFIFMLINVSTNRNCVNVATRFQRDRLGPLLSDGSYWAHIRNTFCISYLTRTWDLILNVTRFNLMCIHIHRSISVMASLGWIYENTEVWVARSTSGQQTERQSDNGKAMVGQYKFLCKCRKKSSSIFRTCPFPIAVGGRGFGLGPIHPNTTAAWYKG